MSIYTRLVAGVLFPLHEKMKGHSTVKAFRGLERSQWLSADELSQLQVRRLREFLIRV